MFVGLFYVAIGIALLVLGALLYYIIATGLPALSLRLFTNPPATDPTEAGYQVAIISTLWLIGLTMLFSVPLGVGAGIFLEEYGGRSRLVERFQVLISNLAGVPSVVFGMLGLALFIPLTAGRPTILAGALTLTLLVFPYIVITSQEALRAVPQSIRDGSLALGASKWQSIRGNVLRAALPGVMTGAILSAARAIGETAPLLVLGAFFYQPLPPEGPLSIFTPLPVAIFGYILQPGPEFQQLAAAGAIILLGLVILLNLGAIIVRQRTRVRW
ncbi:MAG: phosphate ABC transporter permease PstA [Thermoplasmata archaeon]|nr:phosphate ABC transporter permease PstA [Thermoplasmata archaeon]